MSVRIYDGFELEGVTLARALPLLRAHREVAQAEARQALADFMLNHATAAFDRAHLGLVDENAAADARSYLSRAFDAVRSRQAAVRQTGRRDAAIDMSLSVCLIPVGRRLLGVPFAGNGRMLALVRSLPGFVDKGYWNGSDGPDELSPQAWAQRKALWKRALPGWGAPGEFGFTYDLVPEDNWLASDPDTVQLVRGMAQLSPLARARAIADEALDAGVLPGVAPPESIREARVLLSSSTWADACEALAQRLMPEVPRAALF